MSTRVAINGFGRIGRHAMKVMLEKKGLTVVAINDLTDTKTLAHLFTYDTAYADVDMDVSYDDDNLIIGEQTIPVFAERDPKKLPWKKLKVDVVIESTGVFRDRAGASQHLKAGAKAVVISAPGKGEDIETYVRGINCDEYEAEDIIDNASCTTNCTAPVMQVLEEEFGIEKAMLTTVHSYTADQRLQDAPHKDLRRARAAAQNIVPTTTGAAIATAKVIPSLDGVFDGMAIRVPTITVSLIDITVLLKSDVTIDEVNEAFERASLSKRYHGILAVSDEPLVSSDYIGNAYSATVDLGLTNVVDGNLVKVIAWYDNEWGYANRLVEMVDRVGRSHS